MRYPPLRILNALWRWGFLAVILLLLAFILLHLPGAESSTRYGNLSVAIALLLNHVSAHLVRAPKLKKVAFAVSFAWLAFVAFYLSGAVALMPADLR